jgi:hypothetical protein
MCANTPALAVELRRAHPLRMNPAPASDDLSFTTLRILDLCAPTQAGRPAHISAASGMVCIGETLYVVADDEVQLGIFKLTDRDPGELLRLRSNELELDLEQRKAGKPDFEALLSIDVSNELRGLLALGSGSTPGRVDGIWIELDSTGGIAAAPRVINLERLYSAVQRVVGHVNIEGACTVGGDLLLFQRGNRRNINHSVLRFDLEEVMASVKSGKLMNEPKPTSVKRYDLGDIDGVPLGFSDATTLTDGSIIFAAVAEDTSDSYLDGPSAGSALGMLDPAGELCSIQIVRERFKIEGIHAEERADAIDLLAVTDADDPRQPAVLLRAEMRRRLGEDDV